MLLSIPTLLEILLKHLIHIVSILIIDFFFSTNHPGVCIFIKTPFNFEVPLFSRIGNEWRIIGHGEAGKGEISKRRREKESSYDHDQKIEGQHARDKGGAKKCSNTRRKRGLAAKESKSKERERQKLTGSRDDDHEAVRKQPGGQTEQSLAGRKAAAQHVSPSTPRRGR